MKMLDVAIVEKRQRFSVVSVWLGIVCLAMKKRMMICGGWMIKVS